MTLHAVMRMIGTLALRHAFPTAIALGCLEMILRRPVLLTKSDILSIPDFFCTRTLLLGRGATSGDI